MKKAITPIIAIIILLLITLSLAASAWYLLLVYYGTFTDKTISPSWGQTECTQNSAIMGLVNVGTVRIDGESSPSDFYGVRNLAPDSGFESYKMEGWEIPATTNIDVMLLLDKSGSMIFDPPREATFRYCNTTCDRLGYNDTTVGCSPFPNCLNCDGIPGDDDRYINHSIPNSVMYESCPFNDVKFASVSFIDYMNSSKDRVGVISFSPEPCTSGSCADLDRALSYDYLATKISIDNIIVGRLTYISEAINLSVEHFQDNPRPAIKVDILLTDGKEVTGGTTNVTAEAYKARDNGIIIYTIGFGPRSDNVTLQEIAQITGGSYYYAATGEELLEIYEQIAQEILAGLDTTERVYGNSSLKYPAGGDALYSKPISIDYNNNYLLSQYVKIQNMQQGNVNCSLYLYEDETKADNFNEDYVIRIFNFTAPVADFNFTKYSRVIRSNEMDDECNGNPCTYSRIVFEWATGSMGILRADDLFLGSYVSYLDNLEIISPREARLGDFIIIKTKGDGDIYPYFSKASVEPGETLILKDANCMSQHCEYKVMTASNVIELFANC